MRAIKLTAHITADHTLTLLFTPRCAVRRGGGNRIGQ
jgi:hypothetical protein